MKYTSFSLLFFYYLNLFVNKSYLSEYASEDTDIPLKTYEKLDYENFEFKTDSLRTKRDSQFLDNFYLAPNRLKFRAFNRNFSLILSRDVNIAENNLKIELRYSNKPTEYLKDSFSSNYFRGKVENESYSEVIVYYEQKDNLESNVQPLIFAHIRTVDGTNETNYYIEPFQLNTGTNSKLKFLIYRSEDIQSNVLSNGVFNITVCHSKYANGFNHSYNEKILSEFKNRPKRQQEESKKIKNRCHLALVADHKFYKEIGNSNDKLITAYMMNIIVSINNIFTRTKWILDEGQPNTNYGFSIEKIIIHKEPTTDVYDHYNNANSSTNADKILELFSKENWSNYCLAHLFTFQKFENSVLGLAYLSSPLPYSSGGVCSEPLFYKEKAYVNTGLSSYKSISNRQGRLLQKEAELVTAHELGHNWGSEHDPAKPDCLPSEGGNYLMYPYANSGNDRNNIFFSPCSINWISQILKSHKINCFKTESLGYCGNDRIEAGEECDGGFKGRQGLDKCCEYNCKLKPGAQCSDNNHYCCNNCRIAPANFSCYSSPNYFECFYETSFCDGINKDCPSPRPKPKDTSCDSYDFGKCSENGRCNSLCKQLDDSFDECKCKETNKKCMLCCKNVFKNGECKPVGDFFQEYSDSPLYLSDGRPCLDGICEKTKCIPKVKDQISRFWKVIEKASINSFLQFMKRNIVASVIIITLVIWVLLSCLIHFFFDKKVKSERRLRISREHQKYRLNNDEMMNLNN